MTKRQTIAAYPITLTDGTRLLTRVESADIEDGFYANVFVDDAVQDGVTLANEAKAIKWARDRHCDFIIELDPTSELAEQLMAARRRERRKVLTARLAKLKQDMEACEIELSELED